MLWLYNYDMVSFIKASFLITKQNLVKTATLKLETTNNHYSDIFTVTAKAFGSKLDKKKTTGRSRPHKDMPKAGFDQMSNFLGAM